MGVMGMKHAVNKQGVLVHAAQVNLEHAKKDNWVCPTCGQRVIFKVSKRKKPYFAHMVACQQASKQSRNMPLETDYHRWGKYFLSKQFPKEDFRVIVEYYLKDIQQTADVWVQNSTTSKLSIYEYQNTPIPYNILSLRSESYLLITDSVHWYGNYAYLTPFRKSSWLQNLIVFHPRREMYYVPTLNLDEGQVVNLTHLPLLFQKNSWEYYEEIVDLGAGKIVKAFRISKSLKPRLSNAERKKMSISRQSQYREQVGELYQEGILIQELPDWFFTEDWELLLTREPVWLSFAWIYGEIQRRKGETFTFQDFMFQGELWERIKFAPSALDKTPGRIDTLTEILNLFVSKGILVRQENNYYVPL